MSESQEEILNNNFKKSLEPLSLFHSQVRVNWIQIYLAHGSRGNVLL